MAHDHHGGAGEDTAAPVDSKAFWEDLYAGKTRWSGNPNPVLVDVVGPLAPGRALDLGCGEGADVLWLAERGWDATGVDISETAVSRAREAADAIAYGGATGAAGRASFDSGEIGEWLRRARVELPGPLDLVTASFFQSPMEEFDRTGLLRLAGELIRPGGHLFALSHFAPPDWASAEHKKNADSMPTPEGEVLDLAVPAGAWSAVTAEVREREAIGPEGQRGTMLDTVVLLRRER
ncbi:class I SAM-dependent methyltransferase [Dietzia sp.]|uniref:class I SAM-dependent methyltransferase n=1 Tax=Dietzia sp. TaxID=1871616 RepID=UPI002FD90417